jgi:hypothetical protein
MKRQAALCWQEVSWQRPFELEAVHELLTHLAAASPRGAVIWEIRGNDSGIRYLLGADRQYIQKIHEVFKAHGNIQFADVDETSRAAVSVSKQLRITRPLLSLKTDTALSVVRAGVAAMSGHSTETVLQIVIGQAFKPSYMSGNLPDPQASWLDKIVGGNRAASPDSLRVMREKTAQYGFNAVIRIGAVGGTTPQTIARLGDIAGALRILETAGVRITADTDKPERLNAAHIPWRFPLRLSIKELANFLLLPIGESELPGVTGPHPKLLLPPKWYTNYRPSLDRGFAIGLGTGSQVRLNVSPQDSLEHTVILGPTGSGKSTAMLNIIMADIKAGRGVLVIDPRADLVNDVLARIPATRDNDVVILDPSDPCPAGFNPLALNSQGSPALIADAVLAVFKEVFAENWGIRSQDVLSAALLTLAQTEGASLLWLPTLLTDENFRRGITAKIRDRIGLLPFWAGFEAMKDSERRQEIAPVLNKIRQFLLRPSLRGVLGQSRPKFNLADLFSKRRIVLVPLNKGLIGAESARLLGSLVVSLTWTLALSRAREAAERRYLVSVFIDELQDYLSLPTDLSDALAQARGLGVGLTMAHQYREQLPPDIRAGIDANARNKIVFGLNAGDARDMAAMAPELAPQDFMRLPRYQIYALLQSGGVSTGWVSGKTLPPPPAVRSVIDLRAKSMAAYGQPLEAVEREYLGVVGQTSSIYADAETFSKEDFSADFGIGRRKRS